MRMRLRELAWFLAATLAAVGPARGLDNLLPNGDFDGGAGTSGWEALSSEMNLVGVLGGDATNCSGSNAMRIQNLGTSDGHVTLTQSCATSVALDTAYHAWAEVDFGSSTNASVALDIDYFASTDCTGTPLAHYPAAQYPTGISGWTIIETAADAAPSTTQSVAVRIRFIKDYAANAEEDVSVDRVRLAPEGYVYAEDFEIGSICRWNAANN